MAQEYTKVTLMIPDHLVEFITEQSKKHGISRTEEMNEALNDYKFFRQTQDQGGTIFTKHSNGTFWEVESRR